MDRREDRDRREWTEKGAQNKRRYCSGAVRLAKDHDTDADNNTLVTRKDVPNNVVQGGGGTVPRKADPARGVGSAQTEYRDTRNLLLINHPVEANKNLRLTVCSAWKKIPGLDSVVLDSKPKAIGIW